jgi:hypothetical protein
MLLIMGQLKCVINGKHADMWKIIYTLKTELFNI